MEPTREEQDTIEVKGWGCKILISSVQKQADEKTLTAERRTLSALLALALGKAQPTSYQHRADGSPYLEEREDLFLSLSHSKERVALALSEERPLGIDLERRGRSLECVAERYLTPHELERLAEHPSRELALLILWSAKEATYKLLDHPPASLQAYSARSIPKSLAGTFILICSLEEGEREVQIRYQVSEQYVLALASYET